MITQAELKDYQTLRGQEGAIKNELAARREGLLGRIEGGVPVEAGRLRASALEITNQRVTKVFLVSKLGERGYENLRAEAPQMVHRRLMIEGCAFETGSIMKQGAKAFDWT